MPTPPTTTHSSTQHIRPPQTISSAIKYLFSSSSGSSTSPPSASQPPRPAVMDTMTLNNLRYEALRPYRMRNVAVGGALLSFIGAVCTSLLSHRTSLHPYRCPIHHSGISSVLDPVDSNRHHRHPYPTLDPHFNNSCEH